MDQADLTEEQCQRLREAKRLNRELSFSNLPQGLTTIARLYGVADLLSASSAPSHH